MNSTRAPRPWFPAAPRIVLCLLLAPLSAAAQGSVDPSFGEWHGSPGLSVARTDATAATDGQYAVVVGGHQNQFRTSTPDAVGTVDCFVKSANHLVRMSELPCGELPFPRRGFGLVVHRGWMYVFGGYERRGTEEFGPHEILAAEILPSGTLGPWRVAGAIPEIAGGSFKAVGARDNVLILSEPGRVLRAPLMSGTVGTWQIAEHPSAPRAPVWMISTGTHFYVNTGTAVLFAAIGSDDLPGTFAPTSTYTVSLGSVGVSSGYLYQFDRASVRAADPGIAARARILADGSLGPWEAQLSWTGIPGRGGAGLVVDRAAYTFGGSHRNREDDSSRGSSVYPSAQRSAIGGPLITALTPSPPEADGNMRVRVDGVNWMAGFRVQFKGADVGYQTLSATALTFLAPPHLPSAIVTVINPDGEHASSTLPEILARPPSGLAVVVANGLASFSWTMPSIGPSPSALVFEVGRSSGATDVARVEIATVRELRDVSLPAGRYFARLRSRNAAGTSFATSNEVVFVIGAGTAVPSAPGFLTVSVSDTTVSLRWGAPASEQPVSGYILEVGSASGLSNLLVQQLSQTLEFVASAPPGIYFVRVRAFNAAGLGPASNEVEVRVGASLPEAPRNLTASRDGNSVTLSWAPPSSGSVIAYRLEAGSASGLANIAVAELGGTSVTVANVPSGLYYVRVRARNVNGAGAASNEVVIIVP